MNARTDQHGERLIGFSTRLRQLLAQRGHALVPAQLAHDFTLRDGQQSVTPQTFSNWLNGIQLPRTHTFHALAEWLHTTPEYLAEGVPLLHFAPTKIIDADAHQIVEQFLRLSVNGRRHAQAMIAGLVRLEGGGAS